MQASIYVLVDPRDREIRYVGLTRKELGHRLAGHLKDRKVKGHRRNWLDKLARMGLCSSIQLVQTVPVAVASEAEKYWISYFKAVGCSLVNDTDGGESGVLGYRHTPETKEKLRQGTISQFRSSVNRAKVSAVHSGKKISESHKRIISITAKKRWEDWRKNGRYTSEATRAKIRAARRGKPLSVAHRAALSKAFLGKPKSSEHKAKLAAHLRKAAWRTKHA
jgi:hypothetical protein